MIETDVSTCGDGTLVVFHPKMESKHLMYDGSITEQPWDVVKTLRYVNMNRAATQFGLLKLDELLETFKGRCYINIDKFWGNPAAISQAIRRHNMCDQILVKSRPTEEVLRILEDVAPELPFMPVIYEDPEPLTFLAGKNINYVGVEVVFEQETSPLATPEFIENLHKQGKLVWVNSLIYNNKKQLSGGHSDDTAFTVSRDYGWGWLVDRGFDIIQTDWPGMLISYLKESGKYYR